MIPDILCLGEPMLEYNQQRNGNYHSGYGGDTFEGAFLAERVVGSDPFEASHYDITAAALSTPGYGAVAPMPKRARILEFLTEQDA